MTTERRDGIAPRLDVSGPVATIMLSRPDMANRLSPSDLDVLNQHIEAVNRDDSVRVVLIRAQGKYFCAGYDIDALGSDAAPSSLYFGETVDALEQIAAVTIAVIEGGVYGGGTDLALSCDFRIGNMAANMFMPATRLGLHFYPGGLRRYVTRLGLDTAKRLFLTAEKLQAAQMHDIGFLTSLVDADAVQTSVDSLVETLTQMAPLALIGVKTHLNRIASGDMDADAIESMVLQTEKSADLQEGANAWREKRKPRFTGS